MASRGNARSSQQVSVDQGEPCIVTQIMDMVATFTYQYTREILVMYLPQHK